MLKIESDGEPDGIPVEVSEEFVVAGGTLEKHDEQRSLTMGPTIYNDIVALLPWDKPKINILIIRVVSLRLGLKEY